MKHFTKIERQFNYLSKQINQLFTFKKWSKLSLPKRQQYIRRLRQLNSRLQFLIPNSKRLKTLGVAAILISSNSFSQAQVFAPAQTNPYNLVDNGAFVTCTLVDIDGDGDFDLFQGDYDGSTHFIENISTNSSPTFTTATTNPFGIPDIGDLNDHAFVDIDSDGDMDLFMSNGDNLPDIYFFENIGTAYIPSFSSTPTLNPFGLVKTNFNRHPVFVDIDNDGDMDLFFGELYGNIHYYENTGSTSNPAFSTHLANPFGLVDIGHSFTPDFVDIDGDGDMD
ncbi:MAG: VCBS repeat-containing protein, partial [Aureispira sp.]|nr:VCBS repeat-containing protein [Aureispira sp.]